MKSPVTIGPIELRPVDQLVAYANNARTHSEAQIDQIVSSIKEFGFTNPILIDPDNVIIAGHARLRAVRKLGCQQVEVRVLAHLSKTQRRALAIADNQLALNAGWDEELLRAELAALKEEGYDLDVLGFDNGELARLIADEQDSHGLQDADMVPATDVEAVTIMGDLWRLGDHSLLCADATSREALDTVLGGKGADMVFCDPPFNCAYVGRTPNKLRIVNDTLGEKFYEFLRQACDHMIAVCRGAVYICMSSVELHTLFRAFTDAGGHFSTFLAPPVIAAVLQSFQPLQPTL